jgi:hypothetical protein
MSTPRLTPHARVRMRQRAVPELALTLLLDYGDERLERDGDRVRYFTRRTLDRLADDLDRLRKNLGHLRDLTAVELDDGRIKTVMWRR